MGSTSTLRASLFLALCAFVSLLPAPPALAQERLVKRIEFSGNSRYTTAFLKSQVKSREGRAFDREEVYQDIQRLHRLGSFSYVDVAIDEAFEGGVRLIFTVVEREKVVEVRFEGRGSLRRVDLEESLRTRKGEVLSEYVLKVDADTIRERYVERGYLFCEVTPRAVPEKDGVAAVFHVEPGPGVRVEVFRISGNRAFKDKKIIDEAQVDTRATGWLGWLNPALYDPEVLAVDVDRIRGFYNNQGYLDARVWAEEVRYSEDKRRVHIRIRVDEGERYVVDGVEVSGNALFPTGVILEKMRLSAGKPFLHEDLLHDQREIERLYARKAYIFAEARADWTIPEEGNRVGLRFDIDEGREIHVGRIRFRGNEKTRDKVIRRELTFYPGQPFDGDKVEESIARLYGRRFFRADPEIRILFEETDAPDVRDVRLAVEEDNTGNILFGGGIASNVGAFGNFAITERNFDLFNWPRTWSDLARRNALRGGGQTISLRLQPGIERSFYRLFFREPYLFDRPVSLSVDGFIFDRVRRDYLERRRGGSLGLGRRFGKDLTVNGTYRIEEAAVAEVEIDAPSDVIRASGKSTISSFSLGLNLDNRRLDPRALVHYTGYEMDCAYEVAGGPFAGEVDYSRVTLGGEWDETIWTTEAGRRHVVTVTGNAGWMEPYGNTERIPIYERFYLGGPRTLRGFEFRGVGPRERDEFIGGSVEMHGTAEYSFPMFVDPIRGLGFLDCGNLAADRKAFDEHAFRSAYGWGLRIIVPLFPQPIALDFGYPIEREPGDERRVFHFSIGFGY